MQAVDRPFRFTRDFCVVWVLLVVPTFFLTRLRDFEPWYSEAAFLILAPLFATFVLYGPVLFARQVVPSGSRGWFVARVFLSIVLAAAFARGSIAPRRSCGFRLLHREPGAYNCVCVHSRSNSLFELEIGR